MFFVGELYLLGGMLVLNCGSFAGNNDKYLKVWLIHPRGEGIGSEMGDGKGDIRGIIPQY